MPNAYAVVVGIEQYQQSGMEGVDYAHADARDFFDVLVERMDVPKENIDLWLDQDATASRFENDLKYNVRGSDATTDSISFMQVTASGRPKAGTG